MVVTNILKQDSGMGNPVIWIVYGLIFAYYFIATVFPVDKIIGKIYPILGAILIVSTIGVGIGLFVNGYELENLVMGGILGSHPNGIPLFPMFFVTVACGIVSGFHSTQAAMISRSVRHEKEGKMTFYNMMILEGLIAMIWAAAAMGIYSQGVPEGAVGTPTIIGLITNDMFGVLGSSIAMIGVIILPITSGDTALRSLRLMIADFLHIDQTKKSNRLKISAVIFVGVLGILMWSKFNAEGFNILWRYFAWSNQTIAVFAFSMITVYLYARKKNYMMALIPGLFYSFIIFTYIINAPIGLGLSLNLSYGLAVLLSIGVGVLTIRKAKKKRVELEEKEKVLEETL
ncbi:MAG: carbon starvation CstA family protein [Clostridium sp.]